MDPFDAMEADDERGDFLRIGQILIGSLDPPGGAITHEGERHVFSGEDFDAGDFLSFETGGAASDFTLVDGGREVTLDAEDDRAHGGHEQEH